MGKIKITSKSEKIFLWSCVIVLIAFATLFIWASTRTKKEEGIQFKFSKKDEYVAPKNPSYDSTSGSYEVVPPFDSIVFFTGYIQPGSRSYIAVNSTMVKKDSLLKESHEHFVELGDTVWIEHYINSTLNHQLFSEPTYWAEPIYKVKVKSKGKVYDGYLPQSDIAVCVKRLSDKKMLLVRIIDFVRDQMNDTDFYAEFIVADSTYDHIFCQKNFKLFGGEQGEKELWRYYYTMILKTLPAKGLEGVVDVIMLNMNYPACGYMAGNLHVIWDGTQLYYGYLNYEGSDAGFYYQRSYSILPFDKLGKKNSILSVTNTISYEMTDKNEEKILEHDSLIIQYSWEKNKGIVETTTLFSGKK